MVETWVLCMIFANILDSLIQKRFKTTHHIFELIFLYKAAIF